MKTNKKLKGKLIAIRMEVVSYVVGCVSISQKNTLYFYQHRQTTECFFHLSIYTTTTFSILFLKQTLCVKPRVLPLLVFAKHIRRLKQSHLG